MSGSVGRVWLAATALCAGTLWGSLDGEAVIASDMAPVIGTFALGIGTVLLSFRRRAVLSLVAIVLVALGAGMLNAHWRLAPRGPLDALAREVPHCEFTGSVLEPAGGLGTLVEILSARCADWTADSLGVAAIRDQVGPAGASFVSVGWLVPLGEDDFDASLRRAGAQCVIHPRELEVVAEPSGARGIAWRVREGLGAAVDGLDQRAAALVKGLTIGDTSDLDEVTLQVFRNAGLSHILAVSGSNVAIVLGAVVAGLRAAGHRVRILFGYLGLALFVLVVGPDASVLRAAAMGAIALACLAYGRTAEPLAALGLAVIGVLALRPGMLFSVGMHLSAAATAGIILFCHPLELKMQRVPAGLRTLLAATLAAQIAVAPILILVFGEISVVAPVANLLALPAVAPGTVVGLAAGVVGVAIPGLGRLMVRLVSPAVGWILFVADRTGGMSWSLVHVPSALGWPILVAVGAWGVFLMRPRSGRRAGR